ncbi:MAG: hypothetical protein RSA79_03100 [Oscillospiraceae bacterium]
MKIKRPMRISKKIALIFSGIIVFILALFVIIGAVNSRPSKFAKEYFKIASIGDYRRLYDYVDFSGSEHISRDEFVNQAEKYVDENKIVKVYVPNFKLEKTGKLQYEIRYTLDSKEKVFTVILKRQKENQWLFFDEFKAEPFFEIKK